jgi:hypothetical protein
MIWAVRGQIILEELAYDKKTLTPLQARAIFEKAAAEMKLQIRAGRWMPKLR